jgi:DNA polymerase-3 subunit delta'
MPSTTSATAPPPIIGHEQPLRVLDAAYRTQRLAHAYLFAGPDGIGKRLVAMRWAMTINCEAGGTTLCGRCRSCVTASAGTHPDLIPIEPDGLFIKIEQIRTLQEALTLATWSGRRKITVIDRAERMNQEAANCLLKTLEEPPASSLLILISPAPDDLLPTIRSRCQLVRFFPLDESRLVRWLIAERGWSAEEAELVGAIARGCIGQALAGDPTQLREERDRIDQWLMESCLGSAAPVQALARLTEGAETFAHTPEQFERTVRWLVLWLQDLIRVSAHGGTSPQPLRFPSAHLAAARIPITDCCDLAAQLHWSWRASFRQINRQLMLEQWLTQLRHAAGPDTHRPGPHRRPQERGASGPAFQPKE